MSIIKTPFRLINPDPFFFYDNFDRADGTSLTSDWVLGSISKGGGIVSNAWKSTNTQHGWKRSIDYPPDQWNICKLVTLSNTGLGLRHQNNNGQSPSGYVAACNGNLVYVYRCVNNVWTQVLANQTHSLSLPFYLYFGVIGTSFTVKLSQDGITWNTPYTFTDGNISTGRPTIYSDNNGVIDNFSCGSFLGG